MQKIKEIQKVVQKLLREQESAIGSDGAGAGARTSTKSSPVYRGDLINITFWIWICY